VKLPSGVEIPAIARSVAPMQVMNGELDLHVEEDGSPDRPPVLMLHGIMSSHRTWDWLVPELSERFRLLRLDFRGHGRSGRAPGEYMPDGYVADAVAVLEQVGPCVVIGHSLGGVTAAALTQQRPDLVTAALMEDPPLGSTVPGEAASLEGNSLLDGFRLMRESIPALQKANTPVDALVGMLAAAPDTTGAGTFGEMLHADGLQAMAASLLEVDATVLDPVLSGSTPVFLDPTVPFGVPSLIVAADPSKPDAVADPDAVRHYTDLSDDVDVVVVAGAGHLIHDERASRQPFLDAVGAFLGRFAAS
jgi:pimeloyl-ACP methyl ester carboxylesterase